MRIFPAEKKIYDEPPAEKKEILNYQTPHFRIGKKLMVPFAITEMFFSLKIIRGLVKD